MTNKKIFRVLALAAFVAMVAIAPLQAVAGCQKKGDPEKMKGKGCMMKAEGGCMMLKAITDLSAEQKAKLEKLQAEHMKLMAAAKTDMEKLAGDLQGLMKDPVDLKKAEAKIDEIAKMRADMQKKCLAHRLAVRALLTAEQKAKLGEMGCGMMGGMGCGMMHQGCTAGAEKTAGNCGMMKHGQKMEKGKCQKTEEVKKEEKK
jgi:Spy/CpxP family protein refolding chaperone